MALPVLLVQDSQENLKSFVLLLTNLYLHAFLSLKWSNIAKEMQLKVNMYI